MPHRAKVGQQGSMHLPLTIFDSLFEPESVVIEKKCNIFFFCGQKCEGRRETGRGLTNVSSAVGTLARHVAKMLPSGWHRFAVWQYSIDQLA